MQTIIDLLKSSKADVWLDGEDVWFEWKNEQSEWRVYTDRGGGDDRLVIATPDMSLALGVFIGMLGVEVGEGER